MLNFAARERCGFSKNQYCATKIKKKNGVAARHKDILVITLDMKLYSSKLTILFFLTTLGLYSCLKGTQDPTAPSNDPKFKSLRFAKNSRIPHLEKAVFTLSNDTLIQNVDSLPFQTRIDSVFPTFTFAS